MSWYDPNTFARTQDGLALRRPTVEPLTPETGLGGMGVISTVLAGVNALSGMKKIMDWAGTPAADGIDTANLPVRIIEIPDGAAGTEATIQVMAELALSAAKDPRFIMFCQDLVKNVAPKDYAGEIEVLYNWVKSNIRYVNDPRNLEWVQDPRVTAFVRKSGDCDDASGLLAAMSIALGHGAAFRAYKVDPGRPNEFSHVVAFLGYRDPKNGQVVWICCDTTQLTNGHLGWEPPAERVLGQHTWVIVSP